MTRSLLTALFILLSGSLAAQDCEYGAFGCGHQENHEQYQGWKNGTGGSCCNGKDCRPVRARQEDTGEWSIWVPELRRWEKVPFYAVQAPDRFHDGRSHACTADPNNWRIIQTISPLPVYCFSPADPKI